MQFPAAACWPFVSLAARVEVVSARARAEAGGPAALIQDKSIMSDTFETPAAPASPATDAPEGSNGRFASADPTSLAAYEPDTLADASAPAAEAPPARGRRAPRRTGTRTRSRKTAVEPESGVETPTEELSAAHAISSDIAAA